METLIAEVNWMAVVFGAVAAYLLGWAWYSDSLFGKKWRQGSGMPAVRDRAMFYPMGTQAGATFLLAWVIGVTETTDALPLAVLIVCTVAGMVKAQGFFSGKTMYAISVDVGYVVLMGAVMIGAHMVL